MTTVREIDQRLAEIDDERLALERQRSRLVAEQIANKRAAEHVRYVAARYENGDSIVQRGRYARWVGGDGELKEKPTADDMQAVFQLCRTSMIERA